MPNAMPSIVSGIMLQCSDVGVRFGGVKALDGVSCALAEGQVTSVIGPNGAGKTTLLNAFTGMVPMTSGSISLRGERVDAQPPHIRAGKGILRTFQNLEVFTNMTVLENVMAGRHRKGAYGVLDAFFKTPRYRREERECRDAAMRALEFTGIADMAALPAGELAYGNQRLLEMARVIAAEPELLLLDEPAAGLNMRETRELGTLIRRMRDELGITVALVEHDMELVMEVSDMIYVLCFGELLASGTPLEIQRNPAVIAAYLGTDGDADDADDDEDDDDDNGDHDMSPGPGADETGREV
ncbi:MAG: ABC transporter ATP-binding protein [Halodesulfovibrio sp.]